ncbi:MAG: hypothetical protein EXS15_02795 [Phycisphaerales bacterium]|nr:hypothetical protein [Phycisphaerales bacterium]
MRLPQRLSKHDSRTRVMTTTSFLCAGGQRCERVSKSAVAIARRMELPESQLMQIRRGALLQAICANSDGTSCAKPTLEMFCAIPTLRPAVDIPACCHERWDGSGSPRQLKGAEIPIAARIYAIADGWERLASDQTAHSSNSPEQARAAIQALAGTQFDPAIVAVLITIVSEPRWRGPRVHT